MTYSRLFLKKSVRFLKTVKQMLLKMLYALTVKNKVISPKTISNVIFTKHPLLMMLALAEARKEVRALIKNIHKPLRFKKLGICCPKVSAHAELLVTVIQIINGQTVKNTSVLPNGFIEAYNNFNYPSFTRSKILVPEIFQCISEACTEIATSCLNHIVENFEQRLVYVLKLKLQMMFVSMHPSLAHDIVTRFFYRMQEKFSSLPSLVREVVKLFCYQEIVGGETSWPASIHLTEEVKSNIIGFYQPWKQRMGERINLSTLSVNPGCFVPFLFLINDELEKEHAAHKSYDVRRLVYRDYFLCCQLPLYDGDLSLQKLPRGYHDQLELFYRILNSSHCVIEISHHLLQISNTVLFGNIIRTDGFSVDFVFYKRRHVALASTYKNLDLSLDDFSKSE
ncbi:hypothetical protein BDF20DRAFT_831365 [Mycotypha africana]|uniref:uncharacterized protein n=1 Tax=Mycotypha africana TaxID=64632 RepID=UPI00230138CF|nr:uncharacterized protein BDF20DRAFT_831365 [Mycotypha africana]KAI8991313.1 hypothetical protein BDF20DRAFT_831365 [Mycotypha africana]